MKTQLKAISIGILLGVSVIYAGANGLRTDVSEGDETLCSSTGGTLEFTSSIGISEVGFLSGNGLTMAATLTPVSVDLEGLSDEEILAHHGIVDVNGDDVTDVMDLLLVLSDWGVCGNPPDCVSDVDDDGIVSITDLLDLLADWR